MLIERIWLLEVRVVPNTPNYYTINDIIEKAFILLKLRFNMVFIERFSSEKEPILNLSAKQVHIVLEKLQMYGKCLCQAFIEY